MPITGEPNYVAEVPRPVFQNGSEIDAFGNRFVVAGKDEIKASDINNLRQLVAMHHSHVHEYVDSVGRC